MNLPDSQWWGTTSGTWTLTPPVCPYCGGNTFHNGMCPRIRVIEYHEDGTVKRVETFPER